MTRDANHVEEERLQKEGEVTPQTTVDGPIVSRSTTVVIADDLTPTTPAQARAGRLALALCVDGAMLADEAPWVPPRRQWQPVTRVLRFLSRGDFYYDGVLYPMGAVFPLAVCRQAGGRKLRQLVEASMLRVDVLHTFTLDEE